MLFFSLSKLNLRESVKKKKCGKFHAWGEGGPDQGIRKFSIGPEIKHLPAPNQITFVLQTTENSERRVV